jgi:hypothetical protein
MGAGRGLDLGAIALGRWLAGRRGVLGGDRAVDAVFLPIAAGYHAAHYFVSLLTGGQYAVAALNDPLFRGDNLFGLLGFLGQLRLPVGPRVMTD